MIENIQQLSSSLRYMRGWADLLEDLRRHAQETDAVLLPTTSAGPLSELRRVLAETQEYVEALSDMPPVPFSNGNSGFISNGREALAASPEEQPT